MNVQYKQKPMKKLIRTCVRALCYTLLRPIWMLSLQINKIPEYA